LHVDLNGKNAPEVVHQLFPDCEALFGTRNWSLFPHIDRVYVNDLARSELGWHPKYDFRHVLECLRAGKDFRSPLRVKSVAGGITTRFLRRGLTR